MEETSKNKVKNKRISYRTVWKSRRKVPATPEVLESFWIVHRKIIFQKTPYDKTLEKGFFGLIHSLGIYDAYFKYITREFDFRREDERKRKNKTKSSGGTGGSTSTGSKGKAVRSQRSDK